MATDIPSQRGFTLLEVMVAFVILTIGILSTTLVYQTGFKTENASQQRLKAIFLAEDRMEMVKTIPFNNLNNMKNHPGNASYIPAGYPADLWADNQGGFSRQLQLAAGSGSDLIVVRVTVTWNGGLDSYVLASQVVSN